MNIGGVSQSGSLLHAAAQQQASANVLSKVHDAHKAQGESTLAAITATGDESEQKPDGDENGGRFQVTA